MLNENKSIVQVSNPNYVLQFFFFDSKIAMHILHWLLLTWRGLKKRFPQDWYYHMLGHKIFNEHVHYQRFCPYTI